MGGRSCFITCGAFRDTLLCSPSGRCAMPVNVLSVSVSVFRVKMSQNTLNICEHYVQPPSLTLLEFRPLFHFLLLLRILLKWVTMSFILSRSRPSLRSSSPGQLTHWLCVITGSRQWPHLSPSLLFL